MRCCLLVCVRDAIARNLFLGFVFIGAISAEDALAFSLKPMSFSSPQGILQISNSLEKISRVELKVYPTTSTQDGKAVPSAIALPDAEVDQLIRLRPSSFRLGSNAVRNVTYKLIDATTPARFFVCAETMQGIARLRICSRWAPSL